MTTQSSYQTNQTTASVNEKPERKQHSTKIANALKKYIHEIESNGVSSRGDASSRVKDSARNRSSKDSKRASTAGRTRDSRDKENRYSARDPHSSSYMKERDSYQGSGTPVVSHSQKAPRAHSSKNIAHSSTSRGLDNSGPLNQSKRSSTQNQLDASVKG